MSSSYRNRSFNLTKFKAAARRESRKRTFNIPFISKRAAVAEDIEHGEHHATQLRNVQTDPGRSSRNYDDNAESPSSAHGDASGMRRRTTSEKETIGRPTEIPYDSDSSKPTSEDLRLGFIRHAEPIERYTVSNQLRCIFLGSPVMLLLPSVPAGVALHFTIGDSVPTFIVNFVALVPLGTMSALALSEIELRVNNLVRGFLYVCTW
jgi:hypothetical protein